MTPEITQKEIKEHAKFCNHVNKYIADCLEKGTTPEAILESFKNFISTGLKEREERKQKK